MRLRIEYIDYIKYLSKELFDSEDVWLFGSRIDDEKKGGDIDLYIETNKRDNILKSKLSFLSKFQSKFGEQKIDLLVNNYNSDLDII